MKINKEINKWITKAKLVASEAHRNQTRNDGSPYIKHPLRVADSVEDRLKPIAILHDILEETAITLHDLKNMGFPAYIIKAVDLLTHKDGEPNMVYWSNILTNTDAVTVKVADIKDNMNDHPSDYAREKYKRALKLFKKVGVSV